MSNHSATSLRHENNNPSLFNLPALPPSLSDSLTSGTSIPAPSPSPPPPNVGSVATPEKRTSSPRPPMTPPAKILDSSSPSMPGAFPISPIPSPEPQPQTPQSFGKATYTASAYASSPILYSPITPKSQSPKRPNSLRNLLSFRRSHTASPNTPSSPRPASAGGFSLASSFRPSLSGRKSGSLWTRRKSSLALYTNGTAQDEISSPEHNTVHEDEPDHQTPAGNPNTDSPSLMKRQSTTFWRRKSSLALTREEPKEQNTNTAPPSTRPSAQYQPPSPLHSPSEATEPRSWSPPPVLPEVVIMKEIGFLDADDMFGSIGS